MYTLGLRPTTVLKKFSDVKKKTQREREREREREKKERQKNTFPGYINFININRRQT